MHASFKHTVKQRGQIQLINYALIYDLSYINLQKSELNGFRFLYIFSTPYRKHGGRYKMGSSSSE